MKKLRHTKTTDRHEMSSPPRLPWLEWKVGERVVLRRREEDGFYDAVGEVEEVCADYVVIQTRKGSVKVPATKMVTGKRIPPPPRLSAQ